MTKVKIALALFLSLGLVFSVTIQPLAIGDLSYSRGYRDGKQAAREDVRKYSPFIWGVAGGLFGLLGGLVTCNMVGTPSSEVPRIRMKLIEDKLDWYQQGYIEGYKEWIQKAWKKRCWGATWLMVGISATILLIEEISTY